MRYKGAATGRVQGVGFRYFVQQTARELGITGWVRNMDDGSVSMEMQGDEANLDLLARKIRQGNGFIEVESLSLSEMSEVPEEKSFRVSY